MFVEQNIPYSDWLTPEFNNSLNRIILIVKLWLGRLGLILLLPFVGAILVVLYFLLKRRTNKNVKAFNTKVQDLLDKLSKADDEEWREIATKQNEFRKTLNKFKGYRDQRNVASSFIMRKFLKQESRILDAMSNADRVLTNALYPTNQRTITPIELEAMLARSAQQDDLDNSELDALIEKYYM